MQNGPEKDPDDGAHTPQDRTDPAVQGRQDAPRPAAGDAQQETRDDGAQGHGLSAEDLVPGLSDAIAAEEIESLHQRAEAAEAERDELKDRLLRSLAETENVRRRADRDRKDAEIYGGTKLARDLLSVHDNMERALAAADDTLRENHAAFLEGVELTRRELLNAFAKHRIETVVPDKGEKFDPNRHQAMFEAPVPGATPGTVIEVMQAGFTIGDRLLRPALVGIAKAVPKPAEEPAPASGGDAPAASGESEAGDPGDGDADTADGTRGQGG